MNTVIVFLCTPRCGTQWIVKFINDYFGENVRAVHEPIKYDYFPRRNIGQYAKMEYPEKNEKLDTHVEFIEHLTREKMYVEVGWQSIAGIPRLIRNFEDRIRFIHLYRNPVRVAASLVTHQWYTGSKEERSEKAELTPFDNTSILTNYKQKWGRLTIFEKCLYFWTEVNLRAIEIKKRYHSIPFHSVMFEDLFKKGKENSRITLIEMLSFMDLDYKDYMLKAIDITVDKYRYRTKVEINKDDIKKHPQTIAMANRLQYDLEGILDLSRYKPNPMYKKIYQKLKTLTKSNSSR